MKKILIRYFSGYECIRRYVGGYWENWYIDPLHLYLWFKIDEKILTQNIIYGNGTPYCEYYTLNFFDYKTEFDLLECKRDSLISELLN